jgi:hypothetical protein
LTVAIHAFFSDIGIKSQNSSVQDEHLAFFPMANQKNKPSLALERFYPLSAILGNA